MENVLKQTIAAALEFNPEFPKIDYRVIPSNCFGVFVGVERSPSQTLPKWPHNIHGCIGYWDPGYKAMKSKDIVDKAFKVSHDSVWKDSRRKYFYHSIYTDLEVVFKIYFMLRPLQTIDRKTGKLNNGQIFNNQEYGLIVDGSSRATYLPEVFSDKSWNTIRDSLIDKAGIDGKNKSSIKFYAYKCKTVEMRLIDYFCSPFNEFINLAYSKAKFVPHNVEDNVVYVDKLDSVRNVATIRDALCLNDLGYLLKSQAREYIVRDLNNYYKLFDKNPRKYRQTAPFLLQSYHFLEKEESSNDNKEKIDRISNYLQQQLDKSMDSIDPIFELGEILMALNEHNPKSPITRKATLSLPMVSITDNEDMKIFQYNWLSKSASQVDAKYAHYLLDKIIEKAITYTSKSEFEVETNYLAVTLEALCTLYPFRPVTRVESLISDLMIMLENRKDINGLYAFLNDNSRVDITGHVINGLVAIYSMK